MACLFRKNRFRSVSLNPLISVFPQLLPDLSTSQFLAGSCCRPEDPGLILLKTRGNTPSKCWWIKTAGWTDKRWKRPDCEACRVCTLLKFIVMIRSWGLLIRRSDYCQKTGLFLQVSWTL